MLLAVTAALVLVGAYAYYRAETEEIVRERHQAMSAIAELKASQVVQWRNHLMEHVAAAAANRVLARALAPAGPLAAGGRRDLQTLDDLLAFFQGHHEYDTVLVLTADAEVLAGVWPHDAALSPATRMTARQALQSDVPVLSTFFLGTDGAICIDALAAVRDAVGVPLAVLVFRTNASATLHPLIQNWPTPSQSGETLLVAAEGDQVVFLNELRHRSNTALTFRLPRSGRSVPAVQAVEGRVGQFSGRDYRGVEVLADLRPIEGTPWFLVAKIDRSEIVAEARSRAGVVSLVAVLLIGLAAAATAYLYRRHQATLYQDLYESEHQAQVAAQAARQVLEVSEERLRLALRGANQGLYDLDVQTGEAIVTPEYATILGYDPATFRETNAAWIARLHPGDLELALRAHREYMAGERAEYRSEFRQRTATGEWKWVLSLGKLVSHTPDGRPLRMLGTHTDITERKAAEARIRRLAQLYATSSQCNQAIVRSSSAAELFSQICREAVVSGGMKMAWIGVVDPATRRVVPVASCGDGGRDVQELQISVDPDGPFGRGPTATAIREDRPCWCQDLVNEPAANEWHERGVAAGWAASAALPLLEARRPIGALSLYAEAVNAFDEEARKLLTQLATDIGFALDSFAREAARRRAEEEVANARAQLEATLDAVPDLMFELGLDGHYYNYHTPRTGLLVAPPSVFMGRTVRDVLPEPAAGLVMSALAEAGLHRAHRHRRSGGTARAGGTRRAGRARPDRRRDAEYRRPRAG